jgi:hypothetical protein
MVMDALLYVLLGSAISVLVSLLLYCKVSEELRDEAVKLRGETARVRRHTNILLHGMQ